VPAELRNVPGRPVPQGYQHVSIAPPGRLVHIAGQTGTDDDGTVLDGLEAQAERALLNVGRALEAAGASEQDLVKVTIYVVGWEPSMYPALIGGLMAAGAQRPSPEVPVTLLGVASLFEPGMLVEVEAVAVIAEPT
jgi:enamine deaminase RidA (YjgF/YER057c/UK114 family)